MLRLAFAITTILLCSFNGVAQTPLLDSLRSDFEASIIEGDARCDYCYELTDYEMFDSVLSCMERARSVNLSKEEELKLQLAEIEYNSYFVYFSEADSVVRKSIESLNNGSISQEWREVTLERAAQFYTVYGACEKGLAISKLRLEIAKEDDDEAKLIENYIKTALLTRCLYTSVQAEPFLDSAESHINDNPLNAGVYHEGMAAYYYYFDDLPKAVEGYLNAIKEYREAKRQEREHRLYYALADIYQYLEDHRKALVYLQKSIQHVREHKIDDLPMTINSACWSFLKIHEYDSAMAYAHKAIRLHKKYTPSNIETAYPIGNLGLIHRELGNVDSAEYYSKQALDLFTQLHDLWGVAEAYNNLGFIAIMRGDNAEARTLHTKALGMLGGSNAEAEELMNAHYGLYRSYKDSDPAKALMHHEKFMRYFSQNKSKEGAILAQQAEADIMLAENAQRIMELELENEQKNIEIGQKNLRIFVTTAASFLLFVVVLLVLFYWYQRKRIMTRLEETNAINERVISMISHDFRGPMNNIRMMLELFRDDELTNEEFKMLSGKLYKQSSEVSLLYDSFVVWAVSQSKNYEPIVSNFKWGDIIEETIGLSRPIGEMKGVKIHLEQEQDVEVHSDRMASAVILRNVLSNAVKYSNDHSDVNIKFWKEDDQIVTVIQDFGIGMDQELVDHLLTPNRKTSRDRTSREYGAGLGLRLVIQFIEYLNGSISVDSQLDQGSTFTIKLPIQL